MNLYGILSIGYGKRTRYMIREVIENGDLPVDGKVFKTEHAAQEEAKKLGIKIIAVGDCYALAAAYRKATAKAPTHKSIEGVTRNEKI